MSGACASGAAASLEWGHLFVSHRSGHKWWYIDPAGAIQGPFDGDEMLDWFLDGYFPCELLVFSCPAARTHSTSPVRHLFAPAATLLARAAQVRSLNAHSSTAPVCSSTDVWPTTSFTSSATACRAESTSDVSNCDQHANSPQCDVDLGLCHKLYSNFRVQPGPAPAHWRLNAAEAHRSRAGPELRWFYANESGTVVGPLTPAEMQALTAAGVVRRRTPVTSCPADQVPGRVGAGHLRHLSLLLGELDAEQQETARKIARDTHKLRPVHASVEIVNAKGFKSALVHPTRTQNPTTPWERGERWNTLQHASSRSRGWGQGRGAHSTGTVHVQVIKVLQDNAPALNSEA